MTIEELWNPVIFFHSAKSNKPLITIGIGHFTKFVGARS
jgi:hypothetical protein